MCAFHVNEDFFSPIRFDSSVIESSEDSDVDISNSDFALADNVVKIGKQCELHLNSNDQDVINVESARIFTPDKEPSKSVNTKKVTFDETKHLGKYMKKEHSSKNVGYLTQKSKKRVSVLDCNSPELETEQKDLKKRSSSLISGEHNMKDIKIVQKNTTQSLKNKCVENKYDLKYPEGKLFNKTFDNKKNANDKKCKDGKSIIPKERNVVLPPAKENSNIVTQEVEFVESTANPPLCHYEASIEKIVQDCVSFECDKIRQNIYMQQMSFYRQINKIKGEMEQQYSATCEHLFQIIEELKQIKATLQ